MCERTLEVVQKELQAFTRAWGHGRNSEPEGKVISGNRWSLNASKDKQPHGIGKQSDDDRVCLRP